MRARESFVRPASSRRANSRRASSWATRSSDSATATRVLGDAYVKLVISDGIDVRSVCLLGRTVPATLQTALEQRDPVCSVPRCDNPYYLENHHLTPVAEGGATSLENLVRICKWHHDLITYEGWRLTGIPGAWQWHMPPGSDGLGQSP